jgi:hypothetical protein
MRTRIPSRLLAAISVAALCHASARAAPPAPTMQTQAAVSAVWATRHVQYVYRGTTARYSCEGLKGEIERLLTRLGARDLRVRACAVTDRPILFPSVQVSLQALVPAALGGGAPPVAAHWRRVRLFPQLSPGGSCELIAEFRRTFLPLFAARDIEMDATCVPHHSAPGSYLYAQVLAADSPVAGSR